MIGIEIFSGVGGLSHGAKLAGIETKLAVELDLYAAQTFKANHPATTVINSDIRKVRDLPEYKGNVPKFLYGGPPCQGYSSSNQRTRNKDNGNNWLFREFIRVSKLWKPDYIVFENVSGLVHTENGYFLDEILKLFKKIGYHTEFKLLNASDYGVPQKRERLFIVAAKENIGFKFPLPQKIKVTVKEAFADLPSLKNGDFLDELPYKINAKTPYAKYMRKAAKVSKNNYVTNNSELILERYRHIPQGGNWQDIPANLLKNYKDYTRCHGGIYHRLNEEEPSIVIGNYRKNMLIHPTEDRGLSVREAARLQSFPDSFQFKGGLTTQQQQVGNAVPPLLSKEVFSALLRQIK